MKIEPEEGRLEIIVKYKGAMYGSGLELKDFPKWEDLAREIRLLGWSIMRTLELNHYFAKTFMMDSCEHRRGDPDCCSNFAKVCIKTTNDEVCNGIMHYQPVYGGYYYECDKCGRTK